MDKTFEKFINSQGAFNDLWDKVKPENGAMITHIDAVVSYQTDIASIDKTVSVSGITLDNSDDFMGGKIDLPTEEFDVNIYHGCFIAKYQDFFYDGSNFVIQGKANQEKKYRKYKVTLSDIRV